MRTLHRHLVASFALFFFLLSACGGGEEGEQLPVNVIDFTDTDDDDRGGCIQPVFPSDEPDLSLFSPPRFLLTTSQAQQSTSGQALVRPGDPIQAEFEVNSATRKAVVELRDAWAPAFVVAREELETMGNEVIGLVFSPEAQTLGRFYMRISLCGADCEATEVVFDIEECPAQPTADCGINEPYVRSVFEQGELVTSDGTCIDLGGVRGVGSGTVLVQ